MCVTIEEVEVGASFTLVDDTTKDDFDGVTFAREFCMQKEAKAGSCKHLSVQVFCKVQRSVLGKHDKKKLSTQAYVSTEWLQTLPI